MSIYLFYAVAFLILAAILAAALIINRKFRPVLTPERRVRLRTRRLATIAVFGMLVLCIAALWAFGPVRAVGGFGDPRFVPAVVRIRAVGRFHDADRPFTVSFDFGNDSYENATIPALFADVTLRIVLLSADRGEDVLHEETLTDFYDEASACSFRSFGYFTYGYRFTRSLDLPIDFAEAPDCGWISFSLVFAPGETGTAEADETVGTSLWYERSGGAVRLFGLVERIILR